SELLVRVTSDDPDVRMPPADSAAPLSSEEIDVLRRWIAAGGNYEKHWAFQSPVRPALPNVSNVTWCRDPIDRFVLSRMEAAGLEPASEASRETLIRRLYLDLNGTTPTPEAVDRFVSDQSADAYRRLVDEVLASPDYAERFARPWLDLARYSDTNGYEKDRGRTIWPYRDWVIRAIGNDMPFDQFSIEQLAGDMLPEATNQQRIATGFHRNTMMNEEGGIDPQEYRFYSLVDRVATTGTVWMGLTTGCAQCHTHKYDPITHTDYYALLALLNNADEPDVIVEDPSERVAMNQIEKQIAAVERKLIKQWLPTYKAFMRSESEQQETSEPQKTSEKKETSEQEGDLDLDIAFERWFQEQAKQSRPWSRLRPDKMRSTMPKLTLLPDDSVLASGDVTKREVYTLSYSLPKMADEITAIRLEVLPDDSLPASGPGLAFYEGRRGDFFLSELTVTHDGKPVPLTDASHSFGKISVGSGSADAANVIDGEGSTWWSTSGAEGEANQWVANLAVPITSEGLLEVRLLFERHFAAGLGHFRVSVSNGAKPVVASNLPGEMCDWHLTQRDDLGPSEYRALQQAFVRTADEMAEYRKPIERLRRSVPEPIRSLGFRERSEEDRRVTHRHHRGEYLQPKETVTPAVPSIFKGLSPDARRDRLGLAHWLTGDDNPLVARVTANRAWREFFGTGLVDTAGDFGTQSEPPSHPDLLDWLATDLRSHEWSIKWLHRRIVLSATYRQAIGAPPAKDPRNRLLSVFPHRRMNAEQIRDTFLSSAGLLTRRFGGPSVYPPQPAVVNEMAYGSPKWNTSAGGDRFRRSLYTFSKRTAPFAAFSTFDGPTGETCLARRDRSTTPLQALTLLNDEMYLEMARGLAEAVIRELPETASVENIADRIFRRLLVRSPDPTELAAIVEFHRDQADAQQVTAGSEPQVTETASSIEAWALVARALMNTDEAITTP
ncbi:MAG: DUF1553 domain-containing protein, partial [Rubripirellula sp.]